MTTAATTPPTFSGDELVEFLSLIKESDSVELKLTVPEPHQRGTLASLGVDPLQAQIRQVYFFDTPDLALDKLGVVARARRIQGKGDDSVVKLRPVVPSAIPEELRRSAGFRVEVDALPGGFVCSGRLKVLLPKPRILRVAAGELPAKELFTKEQRAFYAEHAPEGINLDDLAILGPINVLKLKYTPTGYKRRLVAELWLYPDGTRILELSTKCLPVDALDVAAETRAFLTERGIDLGGEQQTKTRTALEYFSKLMSTPA